MPLFHHKTDEQKRQEQDRLERNAAAEAEQKDSLASLAIGGIPVPAQRRLDTMRNSDVNFFTSDLTVNEFLLTSQAGLRPITQVMGSSVYHVGWQRTPGAGFGRYSFAQSQELTVVSQAMNHARSLALGRLMDEAQRVGANAVVGVHVTRSEYEWANDMIEFSTLGTAVRWKDAPPSERPHLTNLSGQDFWKLYQSGYWPLGVVAGSTVFYVVGGWRAQMANNTFFGGRQNMELTEFSQGVSLARHRAMGMIHDQSTALQSVGVVGTSIEQDQEEHKVDLGNDQERTDMVCTFHAIGTAIAELEGTPRTLSFKAIVPLAL